jgi:hypothetical protein
MVLFKQESLTFTKEQVAELVVALDIVAIVFFWLALICVKPFVGLTEETIKKESLSGPDFTVKLIQKPYLDSTEDLRPIYWHWAEKVLSSETKKKMIEGTEIVDSNQDLLVNVTLGLNSYKYIDKYAQMSDLLVKKKLVGRKHTLARGNK